MPDAVSLGPLIVPVVRTASLLALVFGAWVAYRVARGWRLDTDRVGRTAEWALYAFVLGSRMGFVLSNLEAYQASPWTALYLWQPGYRPFAGAATAMILVLWRVSRAAPPVRKHHLAALAIGAAAAGVLYVGVLGLARLDLRPETLRAGDQVPDFVLRDLQGRDVRFADLAGRPLVVNFWATWCPPCRREMPALNATYLAHREHGLVIVGVDVGEGANVVKDFLEHTPVSYPIWVDGPRGESAVRSTDLLQRFGGVGLPTTVFIDRTGIVRKIRIGELNRGVLEDEVRSLLR